jgi:anti-sigma regulatory factor (Ser/Thr protein kinase)
MAETEGRGEVLAEFRIASRSGDVRAVRRAVVDAVEPLALTAGQLEALETAVAETVMNAIEHGNGGDADASVDVRVAVEHATLVVAVADEGIGGGTLPTTSARPDLDAKLRGEQRTRGWGLWLIRNLVDDVRVYRRGAGHLVELHLERR